MLDKAQMYNSMAAQSAYPSFSGNNIKTGGVNPFEKQGGAQKTAETTSRSEEMAQIYSYGQNRGINAKDTLGLDGSPYPPEGKGQRLFTHA